MTHVISFYPVGVLMVLYAWVAHVTSLPVATLHGKIYAADNSIAKPSAFSKWTACRLTDIMVNGQTAADMSIQAWKPLPSCFAATVPGTALTNLLANNTWNGVADVYFDTVLETVIPDISVTGPEFYTFAYRTTVNIPSTEGGLVWLWMQQASYRAVVYCNGALVRPLGTLSKSASYGDGTAGMFQRFGFNLTVCSAPQNLAITVSPPDHYGNTSSACTGCGQGGNHEIAQDVISQDTAGWDWIGGTPDRNTGLFDALSFVQTGSILLRDATVVVQKLSVNTQNNGVTQPYATGNATIMVAVSCTNAGWQTHTASLCLLAPELHVTTCQNVTLAPSDGLWQDVVFSVPQLNGVELWWPFTHGNPKLYNFTVTAAYVQGHNNDSILSDSISWLAGIRTVSVSPSATINGLVLYVNNEPIFVRGGNFITPDQLNRYHTQPNRWAAEVLMHKSAGLNMMRLWGGNGGHPPHLYNAADSAGVMLLFEGWMTGDNNGRWAGNASWPLDHSLFIDALTDSISMVRGHPSVVLWCAGNELFPLNASPPADILTAWQTMLHALDYNDKPFVQSSMGLNVTFNITAVLAPADGPYGIMDERTFFTRNPGIDFDNYTSADNIGFQPEIGSVSNPEFESMQLFLSNASLAAFPACNASNVADAAWAFHRWMPFSQPNGSDHVCVYGTPANASEYARRAGLAQFQQYQALFEGYLEYMWDWYSAVIMWKSQSPWPTFRGAIYDNYLAQTGSFWGVQSATGGGAPLHVHINPLNGTLTVANTGLLPASELYVVLEVFEVVSAKLLQNSKFLVPQMPANTVLRNVTQIQWPAGIPVNTTLLYRVTLADNVHIVSQSDYWLSNLQLSLLTPQNYSDLSALRDNTALFVRTTHSVTVLSWNAFSAVINIASPPDAAVVALGNRLDVRFTNGTRVLPCYFTSNYFALVPGESRQVNVSCPFTVYDSHDNTGVGIHIDGWTTQEVFVPAT